MITLEGSEQQLAKAYQIRENLMARIPQVLSNPHVPQLTEAEKDSIIDKLQKIANEETRASFIQTLGVLSELDIGSDEAPTKLPNILHKWAGRPQRTHNAKKEPTPKIGHAKNGRVIRNASGL